MQQYLSIEVVSIVLRGRCTLFECIEECDNEETVTRRCPDNVTTACTDHEVDDVVLKPINLNRQSVLRHLRHKSFTAISSYPTCTITS